MGDSNIINVVNDSINSITFVGRYYGQKDWNTGLTYFWHRWYDSTNGRWINRDPIGIKGGINVYEYVKNDSVNKIDFLGFCCGPEPTPTPTIEQIDNPDSDGNAHMLTPTPTPTTQIQIVPVPSPPTPVATYTIIQNIVDTTSFFSYGPSTGPFIKKSNDNDNDNFSNFHFNSIKYGEAPETTTDLINSLFCPFVL